MMDALVSADDLRIGLRRLAKTAVGELSMDPPSLLACVNQTSSLFAPLQVGADFTINILHSTHGEISPLCSGSNKGEARFARGNWLSHESGLPYLADGQATSFCRQAARFVHGTHVVTIGNVFAVHTSSKLDPLAYRYANIPEGARG
jgi:flavin reductase (DIM6/NTAB) family NADH-FMN oxidoreductase RutF